MFILALLTFIFNNRK
ncbi:MAG: hypothetical protein ACLT46_17145 [Hungatella sp.]